MEPMSDYAKDLQHSGMIARDLDETINFYTNKLGFELVGIYPNGENRCAFLRLGHLTIETWEGEHALEMGLKIEEDSIQSIPTFWQHGIRYFNVIGPNQETIEFCQIL